MADTEVEQMSTEDIPTEDITMSSSEDKTAEDTPKNDETEMITEESAIESEPSKVVKEELVKEETEHLQPDSIIKETVDENGDVFEETTEVQRKVVKRTMKITETSSTTKTTTMTTPAKLYGKDLSEYDEVDVDALLAQLSPEEINILAKEVDPDDNFLPPNQRCSYECTKDPTGPLNRKKLIEHINKEAMETPDLPEQEPYVKGTVRGKKWVPPPRDEREIQAEEQIAIDLGDEYEHALSDATQEEIIDLAAILGFHSMMNQDQYHASLLNKGQPVGMGWDGITKSTQQKLYPMDPPNNTDVEDSVKRVKDDDPKLIELNLNNIKNISDEKFEQLFDALPQNEHLEVLSLTNVGLTDKTALLLAEAIEKSKTLRVLNVETNFISPPVIVTLVKALLKARTIEEFRASNQRSTVLGNKIEMEITDLVEKNTSLLRLGLHLEFNDARHRVAAHLQRNIDRNEHELRKGISSSPILNATRKNVGTVDDLSSTLSSQKTIKAKSPKPLHTVLTPQERIDSKSDLIASLVSQKQADRGKGEMLLPAPQAGGVSRSPSRDRKISPRAQTNSPFPRDTKAPVEVKEEISPKTTQEAQQNNVEEIKVEKTIQKKDERQPSPARHPKIGDLRNSSLSRAVKEETASQENGLADKKPTLEEIKTDKIQEKVLVPEQTPKENETKDLSLPSVTDTPPVLEKPLPPSDQTLIQVIEQPQIKFTPEEKISETKTEIETPKKVEISTTPDQITKEPSSATLSVPNGIEDRERISKSASPTRYLEQNLSLIRAKIDSFAEVADSKLSNLRSRIEDISRDTTDTVPLKYTLPLVSTPNSIGITFLYQKQMFPKYELPPAVGLGSKRLDKITEDIDESSECDLEEKSAPLASIEKVVPKSVTANEQFSKPQAPIPILSSLPEEAEANLSPQSEKSVSETIKPNPEQNVNVLSESSKVVEETGINSISAKVIEQTTKIEANEPHKPDTSVPSRTEATIETKVQASSPKQEEAKSKSQSSANNRSITSNNPAPDNSPPQLENSGITDISLNLDNPATQTAKTITDTSAVPILGLQSDAPPQSRPVKKVEVGTQSSVEVPPILGIKKDESIQIQPTKRIEVATQSTPPPSPLSRLSFNKGDQQNIDPIKKSEIGTQSLPKPNPLSKLSSKKADHMDIKPIQKAEIATQSSLEEPRAEASSQTIEDEPIETLADATQTPLVYSSLEHDFVFPGLRRVPQLSRPKTIITGDGDRVVLKPSTKPINEILMLLYPNLPDYSTMKYEDSLSVDESKGTVKELEEAIQRATEVSDEILKAAPEPSFDDEKLKDDASPSIKTELTIPLVGELKSDSAATHSDDNVEVTKTSCIEAKFTTLEKVSLKSTTIAGEAFESLTAEAHTSKTSIRSANMWQTLSSNLLKASEQTLIDISKSAETSGAAQTKFGKVSIYSSVEDLTRSKYSDRHLGGLIKTVETTSVYSSTEDITLPKYIKYSDRYKDDHTKELGKVSVYSSTEDLPHYSPQNYSDRQMSNKAHVYSSAEDISPVPSTKFSERYSDARTTYFASSHVPPPEDLTLLPRSKFSDRYKEDQRSQPMFPISKKPYYKSSVLDEYSSRSRYKTSDNLTYKSKITDRSTYENSLQSAVLSSISRNQSALRPYTYVPSSNYTDLAIDHVRSRPSSPATIHKATLQLNISPTGIREITPTRTTRYYEKDSYTKPNILISRVKDDSRSFRAISPIERLRPASNILSPHQKVSDQTSDELADELSQPTLSISSASAATSAIENNASTTTTTTDTTPTKRANIMDTIKMLKNRVRDVITTEDRFNESHHLPSS